jgi:hypothetical protein
MKTQDPCRFCRIYAIAVVVFAALMGAATAVQFGIGLRKFGGHEYLMRAITLNGVNSLAPGATGSALLLAFVLWGHSLPIPQLQADLPRLLKRAMLVALPGYLAAALVLSGVALVVSHFAFGVPWRAWSSAFATITRGDWSGGAFSALVDAGLIVVLAWRYLARLQASVPSLPKKLVIVWTVSTGLRMTVGLLGSLLLPA